MFLLFSLVTSFGQAAPAPVLLKHTFTKNVKSEYLVDANLQLEERMRPLTTFLPEDVELKYTFFTNTIDVNNAIATVRYSRPSMAETGGTTPDADPTTKVDKINLLALMQMSSINEVIDFKDLTPKKKKPEAGASQLMIFGAGHGRQIELDELIGPFVDDLERLSVFIGGPDSSLDLEPKFDLAPVKVGDTWKRTVGYQPQKLASKTGKTVVQRLDLTYTYKGVVESQGKQVHRVEAELILDTDLGTYVNDLFNAKPENTGLKAIPTHMKMTMKFDLDMHSMQTIYATVKSEGGFKIFATEFPDAVIEQNIKGSSTMNLVRNTTVPPIVPKK